MGRTRPLSFEKSGLDKKDWNILKKLSSPEKIQNFIDEMPFNFEEKGETYRSVKGILRAKEAHCFEGALLGAAALWVHGERPLLLDLRTVKRDDDHVVVLFQRGGRWGAISKTNHAVLRYRDPVYRDPRELAMSYFHEYFLSDGSKTLRKFSKPFDLSRMGTEWLYSDRNLFSLVESLDKSPHKEIAGMRDIQRLRPADRIEKKILSIMQYHPRNKKKKRI